ncbi:MAG: hypothetical protein INR62_08325 [Rhodospirillales bacterium]|nr:hypothetical protein [Acetobacter sp.]
MMVKLILHCMDRDEVLFEGPAQDCPPVPRVGDEIACHDKVYKLEGVRHVHSEHGVTIHLLA